MQLERLALEGSERAFLREPPLQIRKPPTGRAEKERLFTHMYVRKHASREVLLRPSRSLTEVVVHPSSCGACVGVHACLQRLVQGSSELKNSPARKLFGSFHLTLLISGISRRRCRCFFWVCRPRASQRDGSVHTYTTVPRVP